MSNDINVRAKPAGIEVILRVYYENAELGTSEIAQIFPGVGRNTICKLKKQAQALMAEKGIKSHRAFAVNTEIAYEAWKIDVEELEKRRQKLLKLNLT